MLYEVITKDFVTKLSLQFIDDIISRLAKRETDLQKEIEGFEEKIESYKAHIEILDILIARGIAAQPLTCECRTTELLLDPLGFVWGCHFYLYQNWEHGGPKQQFAQLAARNNFV